MLWTPDIVVLNEVGKQQTFESDDSPLVLADENFLDQFGVNALWTRRLDVTSRCDVDMRDFPFDSQRCSLVIGSWASSQRQMILVPQDSHRNVFDPTNVHTEEFFLRNLTVTKADVYTRGAAQRFEEIRYEISLQRYPHFYVTNFILPLVAVTMLTIGTMWMRQPATRMNSGTKLLLCVVQIMNITAQWRPPGHGDIWLDRFQCHCLALSMSAVLQSLVMDYLSRHSSPVVTALPWRTNAVDILLRTVICFMTILVFVNDFCTVKHSNTRGLYGTFHAHSTQLLVGFLYIVFLALGISSACSTLWLVLPAPMWKGLIQKSQACGGSVSRLVTPRILVHSARETPRSARKERVSPERIRHGSD